MDPFNSALFESAFIFWGVGKKRCVFFFGVVFVAKESGALVDRDEAASNLHHSWTSSNKR